MLDLKDKRILVVGGSGFIGSYVIRALKKRGVPDEHIFAPGSAECDLRKRDDCARSVKGAEIVFDCAAVPGDLLLRSKIPGELFYENLVIGTQLLEAARLEGVEKVVTIGSATEYPEGAPVPLSEKDLWNGLPSPTSIPYGLPRRIVALQGELYRKQSGFNSIHIILTNAYGPGERYESGYMVPSLIEKILNAKKNGGKEIDVWGKGLAVRDLIYAEDAAEGIMLAAERYNEAMPLNIGSGVGISIKDLVALLCDLAVFKGVVRWDATKPEGDLKRLLDVERSAKLIGFKTRIAIEDGLKKTIDWHIANS